MSSFVAASISLIKETDWDELRRLSLNMRAWLNFMDMVAAGWLEKIIRALLNFSSFKGGVA